MGLPHLKKGHPGQYGFIESIVALTRRLDTERPVIDNDGWEHTDVTDIFALHDYTPTADKLRTRYAETLQGGPLPPISGGESPDGKPWGTPLLARNSQYHGQPVVLSEVGGFMMLPQDTTGKKWTGFIRCTAQPDKRRTAGKIPRPDAGAIRTAVHLRLFATRSSPTSNRKPMACCHKTDVLRSSRN
jgi:hypothetical protein